MKIGRTELLDALNVAKPALASKDLVAELTHFWFDGKSVVAFNDVLGIDVPMKTDFKGGLRGSLALGVLEKSRAKEVEMTVIEPQDGSKEPTGMMMKVGGARLNLSLLDPDRSMWRFPQIDENKMSPIKIDLLNALERVMVSVGDSSSVPDQLGVTMIGEDEILNVYSTDSKTVTWMTVKRLPSLRQERRFCIPGPFVEQVLRLCKKGGSMSIFKGAMLAQDNAGVRLYSKLIETPRPLNFEQTFTDSIPKNHRRLMVPIPIKMKLALERVSVVLEDSPGDPVELILADDILKMKAQSSHGEIRETMRLEKPHAQKKGLINPQHIKRVLPYVDHLLLTEECLVLTGPHGFLHLISRVGS